MDENSDHQWQAVYAKALTGDRVAIAWLRERLELDAAALSLANLARTARLRLGWSRSRRGL